MKFRIDVYWATFGPYCNTCVTYIYINDNCLANPVRHFLKRIHLRTYIYKFIGCTQIDICNKGKHTGMMV